MIGQLFFFQRGDCWQLYEVTGGPFMPYGPREGRLTPVTLFGHTCALPRCHQVSSSINLAHYGRKIYWVPS